jgi:hypothetical protein
MRLVPKLGSMRPIVNMGKAPKVWLFASVPDWQGCVSINQKLRSLFQVLTLEKARRAVSMLTHRTATLSAWAARSLACRTSTAACVLLSSPCADPAHPSRILHWYLLHAFSAAALHFGPYDM